MKIVRHSVAAVRRRPFRLAAVALFFGILAISGGGVKSASAAVPASASLAVPDASSAPFAEIQNYNSGLCIEAHGASTQVGLQLDQWGCRGATNELWRVYEYSPPDFQFIQENDSQCMNVDDNSKANDAAILQWSCTRGSPTPNEIWAPNLFIGDINGIDYYEFYNPQSGKCLNVDDASTAEGAKIIQYTCLPKASDEWFALPFYGSVGSAPVTF